jgi:hypothetical protein
MNVVQMPSPRDRLLEQIVTTVGRARPHLVDPFDAIAYLESIGYTDARVRREVGLADVKTLGEHVYDRLCDRALPVAGPGAIEQPDTRAGGWRAFVTTVAGAAAWATLVAMQRRAIAIDGPALKLALLLSVMTSVGFVEVTQRLGRFYSSVGQPWLGRVALWYFLRLAALATVAIAAAGVAAGRAFGVAWSPLVLWADEVMIFNALWCFLAAVQMPGVVARRRPGQPVPIPRMTVIAFRESGLMLVGAFYALVFGAVVNAALAVSALSRPGYAAVGAIGGAALTFVLATLAVRHSSRPRTVSFS